MPSSSSVTLKSATSIIVAIGCVLLAASFLGTSIPGTNEAHYFSKARSTADPDWCVNDFFLQSQNAHAVFFAIIGPFAKTLPFPVVLAVGRLLSLLLVAIGLHSLCSAVGCCGRRSVLSAALFFLIGLTGNFSGEWIIGGFESKVPAYGFAFLGIATCIRNRIQPVGQRYVLAGAYIGLAVSLHPVVGIWTAIALSMTEIWLWLRPHQSDCKGVQGISSLLRRGSTWGITSLVFALPGLIPALQMLLSADVNVSTKQQAKQIQVFYRLAHHLDPTRFSTFSWCHTAGLLAVLCATVVWLKRHRQAVCVHNSEDWQPRSENYLLIFLICTAIIAAIGIAIGWHSQPMIELSSRHWRAALLQFYPFRLFDAFLPLTTAIFLSAIGFGLSKKDGPDEGDSPTTVGQKTWHPQTWHPLKSLMGTTVIATAVIATAVCGMAAFSSRANSPTGYSKKTFAEWKRACEWLKNNTAKDALIYSPRESYALKLFAERAEYVCFKDCPQDAEGIVEWNRRLWKRYYWSRQAYQDSIFDEADLEQLHKKTGADYVLTRQLEPFSMAPIWQSGPWRIYPTVVSKQDAKLGAMTQ